MNFEAVKSWLTRRMSREANLYRLKGILGLALAPLALAAALTLVYWLLRLFTHDASNNLGDPRKCLWITLAVLPCLFIGNRLAPRRNLMEERMSAGPETSLTGHYFARREALGLLFLWIVFTGPRLFNWAADSFREAKRSQQMDVLSCAAVLWMLISSPRKVPFEDIQRDLEWLNWETVLPDLKRMPGVLFLQSPPTGLSLTTELRESIRTDLRANVSQ
jgi:hypothetical protein